MTSLRILFLICSSLTILSCSTIQEAMDPKDTTFGYVEIKNKDGETVHQRKRVIESELTPIENEVVNSNTKAQALQKEKKAPSNNQEAISPNGEQKTFMVFDLSGGDGHIHTGIGIAHNALEALEIRGGASLFNSKELYAGLDLSARAKLPMKELTPFVGLGGYGGDSKSCEEKNVDSRLEEHCEKKFLFALYLEAGVRFNNYALFTRKYSIDEADISLPVKYLWGVNIYF